MDIKFNNACKQFQKVLTNGNIQKILREIELGKVKKQDCLNVMS